MKIHDKNPDKILINVDFLKTAISENETYKNATREYENHKNMLLAFLGALTSCLLTLIPSWNSAHLFVKIFVLIVSGIFLILSLWSSIQLIQANGRLKNLDKIQLNEYIIDEAKKKIKYTALLIIAYQNKYGEVKFMTEKHGNYLVYCPMMPDKRIEEQKEGIINYLATSYNVQKKHVVEVTPLSSEPFFSIKPIHGEETQNGFVFFQIRIKKKEKQDLVNHKNVSWKTIKEMEEIPELMGKNQDIVMALHEIKNQIVDSFEDSYGPTHIIWNITENCPYACAICATRDKSRKELSTEEKLQVLNHIFSAKEYISTLDFAGGDPMYDIQNRTVIMQAINSLGEDHVSVTTTGKGIEATGSSSEDDISKLLRRCEVTIDASHENLSSDSSKSKFPRTSPEYCSHNLAQIQSLSENIQHLVVNIPLLDDDLSDTEIDNLVLQLKKLKQDYAEIHIEAQIIRLMPVGAFGNSDKNKREYERYNPVELAKRLKKRIEEIGISCRFHCSLRILSQIGECDEHCNMLAKKIGIDCSGNVFACTWGAYLNMAGNKITENPFYLGNLVSSNLKDILEGQGHKTHAYKRISRQIANRTHKPYCEAISWYFKNVVDENHDPLAK